MYTVIGIESIDYTNKQGKPVLGTKLHCTFESDKVVGHSVESIYCSDRVDVSNVELGSVIEVYYNRYRQVAQIQVISF